MASVDCTEGKFNISLNPLKIVGCDNNFTRSDCKRGGLRLDEWNSSRRELELDELLLTVPAVIINLLVLFWGVLNPLLLLKKICSVLPFERVRTCALISDFVVQFIPGVSISSSSGGGGPDLAHACSLCIYL